MKKILLLACGAAFALSTGAQNKSTKYLCKKPTYPVAETSTPIMNVSAPISERRIPLVITNATVTDVTLGCAGNILGGYTKPGRSILDYCPAINTLTMIHRSGGNVAPCSDGTTSSGSYMFDFSTNGGTTWNTGNSKGPICNSTTYPGRYPGGAIYNPTGNTNPDSAFIAYHGAMLSSATGTQWFGYHTGAAVIGKPAAYKERIDLFHSNVNFYGLIPDCFSIDNNGFAWISD